MRRRLVAAIAGVSIVALLLYAVPRAFLIADMVRDQERRLLERSATLVADTVDTRIAAGEPPDRAALRRLLRSEEEVAVHLPDGSRVAAGDAARGGAIRTTRTLDGGGRLTMWLSGDAVDDRIADAMLPIVLFGSLATAAAVALALTLARRLSAPFLALRDHAELAHDDDVIAPRSGLPEADLVADALDRSRRRVADLLRHERQFSSNASHQLRTPLAALRLRIEDLTLWPDTSPAVREELTASLAEIDRLADTVTDLLELARSGGIGGWSDLSLAELVGAAIARWAGPFQAEGRTLVASSPHVSCDVATSERAVNLVLDVLLENALVHGRGTVDLSIEAAVGHVALRVADEGSMDRSIVGTAFDRDVRSPNSPGSGIGLALARTIAESAGARLQVVSRDPTVFELSLPV